MSTHNPLESRGYHGPPAATSEADDTGLGAFAPEGERAWQSDFADEDAPGEADAHQPFDDERDAVAIEDIEPDVESEPIQPDPDPDPDLPTPSTPRWIFAAARACVIFVLGLATFYYTQEPNRVKRTASSAAPKPSSMPAPAPAPAIHAEAPPQLAVPSAEREGGQSAPSADSRPAAAPIRSSYAKATEDRSAANTRRPLKERTEVAVAPATESTAPAVAATPEPKPIPAAANNPEPAPIALEPINLRETELTQHRAAIRELLDAYRESYDRLDALSAARVWPGVDMAALTRAFSTLNSQQVDFDSCKLDLDQPAGGHFQRATALCSGSVTYTRRVGNASPQSRALAWTFDLDRTSGRWLIRRVVAK